MDTGAGEPSSRLAQPPPTTHKDSARPGPEQRQAPLPGQRISGTAGREGPERAGPRAGGGRPQDRHKVALMPGRGRLPDGRTGQAAWLLRPA